MIVRILGEGQFEVADAAETGLTELDAALERSLGAEDEAEFRPALAALLDKVRSAGTPLAAERLATSDLVLPHDGATMAEVRELLSDNGHPAG